MMRKVLKYFFFIFILWHLYLYYDTYTYHDEKGIKEFGIKFGVKMAERLIQLNAPLLHFYTLNFSTEVKAILKALGYPTKSSIVNNWNDLL